MQNIIPQEHRKMFTRAAFLLSGCAGIGIVISNILSKEYNFLASHSSPGFTGFSAFVWFFFMMNLRSHPALSRGVFTQSEKIKLFVWATFIFPIMILFLKWTVLPK